MRIRCSNRPGRSPTRSGPGGGGPGRAAALLRKFCDQTTRHRPQVVRQIIALFFADGLGIADQRLKAGTWEVHNAVGEQLPAGQRPDMSGWSPEERAEWLVSGSPPARLMAPKRKGGAA